MPIEKHLGRRMCAALLDYTGYFAACFVYFWLVSTHLESGIQTFDLMPHILFPIFLWMFWFPWIESRKGQTLFKRVFKLKVVSDDGRKLSFEGSFNRHLLDIIDLFFLVGVVLVILSKDNKRLGDKLGKTHVVAEERFITQSIGEQGKS